VKAKVSRRTRRGNHTAAAPVAAPRTSPLQLTYQGGHLISNVKTVSLYWGNIWSKSPHTITRGRLEQFFGFVVKSPVIHQLAEYSTDQYQIGEGQHLGSLLIEGVGLEETISDETIRQVLSEQIMTEKIVPSSQTVFFVLLPPGRTVEKMGLGVSCDDFCGYHDHLEIPDEQHVFYCVIPYPECERCRTQSKNVVDAITRLCAHELVETITDPIPPTGWYDDTLGEVADTSRKTKLLNGFVVEEQWSQTSRGFS
jgi:hypothetical protein